MIDYSGKKFIFSKRKPTNNPIRIFIGFLILLGLMFVLRGISAGQINPFLSITPTPTRSLESYAQEGEAHFAAGNLEKAIAAYKDAVRVQPNDPDLWAELARIQVYSTSQITVDKDKKARLEEAMKSVDSGLIANKEYSQLYAVKAFALDWYGVSSISGEKWQDYLIQGEQAAQKALQYDNTNAYALAYLAELLVDEQRWTQAQEYIKQALERDPTVMDVHRVNGYVLESVSAYPQAIEEYNKAISITPNLNFLYISVGANYRKLANMYLYSNPKESTNYYNLALDAFDKAAKINSRLGVKDPIPLSSIANTYVQMGSPLYASANMLAALNFKPEDSTSYGQLGVIYYKSRNYEGAILPLQCAVRGCNAQESCKVREGGVDCTEDEANNPAIVIQGLPLTTTTVIYYYIYGSALAGMNTKATNYCSLALPVFAEITAGFGGDSTIMAIVDDGVAICKNSSGAATATPSGTNTPYNPYVTITVGPKAKSTSEVNKSTPTP
jgi:tetratricopeptide (TPR) repeat protein